MTSGPFWRTTALQRLARETFDVLVVGGGATGAGIARDAALRGLRVALCDHGDFAGQTSSQSSKLIHGGLRYLQYGNFGLVFEGLTERRRLLKTAPHLCRPTQFLFPTYQGERPSRRELAIGIGLYNALGLWRPPVGSGSIGPSALYQLAPWLRTAGLVGAAMYVDCQTDDARLVLETVLDAESAGAVVASYVNVARPQNPSATSPTYSTSSKRWRAMTAVDRQTSETFAIEARAIVNATGPFSDAFGDGRPMLRPTLGVHLVFAAARLPTDGHAFVIRSPRDGRLLFILPADHCTIVGTTDTDWKPPGERQGRTPHPDDEVRARGDDVDYLLNAANHAFPAASLTASDVLSTFAGLRPLIATAHATPSQTSREHEIWVDRHGVLAVAGGKLTTYRKMAEEAVDKLVDLLASRGLDRPLLPCSTRTRPLPGAAGTTPDLASAASHELATDVRSHLLRSYGTRASLVLNAIGGDETLGQRIAPPLPYLRAEIAFAARHDHAVELEDVLRRRVPLFRDTPDQGLSVARDAADIMAPILNWSPACLERSLADYRAAVAISRQWRTLR